MGGRFMQEIIEQKQSKILSIALRRLEDFLHSVGCLCLIIIAGLIIFDALKRLTLGTPLQVQFELTELFFMPAVASLSLSRVFRDKAHLAIEIFTTRQFGFLWPYLNALILILSLVLFGGIAWQSGMYAADAFMSDDIYIGTYDWHLWLAYISAPVGASTLCLRLIYDLFFGKIDNEQHMTQIVE
jgi:TRAP-type C4-dicarboxylate transport system permease small subunit